MLNDPPLPDEKVGVGAGVGVGVGVVPELSTQASVGEVDCVKFAEGL